MTRLRRLLCRVLGHDDEHVHWGNPKRTREEPWEENGEPCFVVYSVRCRRCGQ